MKINVYQDKAKEWRWHLVHANGNIMADSSEGYKNRTDCMSSLATVSNFLSGMVTEAETYSCGYCKHTEKGQLKYCGLCGQKIKEEE